jgi:hypothetical protein
MKVLAAIDADVFLYCIFLGRYMKLHNWFFFCIWLPSNSDSKTVQNYEEIVQIYEDVVMGFFANFML